MDPEQVAQCVVLNNAGENERYIENALRILLPTVSDALRKFREKECTQGGRDKVVKEEQITSKIDCSCG